MQYCCNVINLVMTACKVETDSYLNSNTDNMKYDSEVTYPQSEIIILIQFSLPKCSNKCLFPTCNLHTNIENSTNNCQWKCSLHIP